MSSFTPPDNISVESLYSAVVEIFWSRSPEKPAVVVNEAESWLSLIPGNLRCVTYDET